MKAPFIIQWFRVAGIVTLLVAGGFTLAIPTFFFSKAAIAANCDEACSDDGDCTGACAWCNGFVCESCCGWPDEVSCPAACTWTGTFCRDDAGTNCPDEIPEVPKSGWPWLLLSMIPIAFLIPWLVKRRLEKRA